MKTLGTVAALAAAAVLIGITAVGQIAIAQTVVDPSTVYQAPQLQAPLPAAGTEFNGPAPIDGEVGLPYGDILADLLTGLGILVGGAAAWLLRRLPKTAVAALDMVSGMFMQRRANELLELAITYGINTTAGAVRGKTLTVKVGNEVLERAFEYAVRHAPALVNKLGGILQIREKIIARLDLESDAAVPTPRPPAESLIGRVDSVPAPAPAGA